MEKERNALKDNVDRLEDAMGPMPMRSMCACQRVGCEGASACWGIFQAKSLCFEVVLLSIIDC